MSVEKKALQIVGGCLVEPEVWARVAELAAFRSEGMVRVTRMRDTPRPEARELRPSRDGISEGES